MNFVKYGKWEISVDLEKTKEYETYQRMLYIASQTTENEDEENIDDNRVADVS